MTQNTPNKNEVVQWAMLSVSDQLAEATKGQGATEIESFDLTPEPGLPGLVFMHNILSPEATTLNPD